MGRALGRRFFLVVLLSRAAFENDSSGCELAFATSAMS
jgi:hypothetical protein